MTTMDNQITDYLEWMKVHNYAKTTIENRRRYLGYFSAFTYAAGIDDPAVVSFECLLEYQQQLFNHRKRDGFALSFGTQVQRLVPVTQFFSWLRREKRIAVNPATDLLMPRPDRKLPEATLSASEMAKVLGVPDVGTPLGLRDRAVLEVFYSCAMRRNELICLWVKDVDFERGRCSSAAGRVRKIATSPSVNGRSFGCASTWERSDPGSSRQPSPITSSCRQSGGRSARTGSVARSDVASRWRASTSGVVATSCGTASPP